PHRIDFIHSNCVLMEDVVGHAREIVRDFYGAAAEETQCDVCCPVPVDRECLAHIPDVNLERSYGCGSPVFAAEIAEGETVVDLGSGGGIECFAAAKMVGPGGRVIGVDMTPEMLALAEGSRGEVAANLGYDNVRFVDGYLESIPLGDDFADVVISNCVINLSPQKLRVFGEILRILKPGGRMVIADITAGDDVPDHIKFNPRMKGECIGGALRRDELLPMLTKLGFGDVRTLSEVPWREVDGVEFFSDTVVAVKPQPGQTPLPYVGIQRADEAACGCAPTTGAPSESEPACCPPPECAPSAGETEACDETDAAGPCCPDSGPDDSPCCV
ncbi:MAG: methyltransferase domain-containing protein, partial [Armatimonadota bacterium]